MMEKAKYERPEAEVLCFGPEDIITTSTETPEVGSLPQSVSLF